MTRDIDADDTDAPGPDTNGPGADASDARGSERPEPTPAELRAFERRIEALFRAARASGGALLAPETILGDFRIVRRIGSGGMASVYEAIELPLQRRVALKVLSGALGLSTLAIDNFHREAVALGRQHHQGVVVIHRYGQVDGVHFIAQELVGTGRTLADEIRERAEHCRSTGQGADAHDARRVAELFAAVADALTHVHASGVIHRDLKPSNILLDEHGAPKVSDFGLAFLADELADRSSRAFLGTPCYAAPEQVIGRKAGADALSDVFSLGVTMYERLCLRRPFDGDHFESVIDAIQHTRPPRPDQIDRGVDPSLARICMRAIEKLPADRYPTMRAMADELRRWSPPSTELPQI